MEKIILMLLSLICLSCNPMTIEEQMSTENELWKSSIIIIDGCEYFKYKTYYHYNVIEHKGNCKNPIHIYNAKNPE